MYGRVDPPPPPPTPLPFGAYVITESPLTHIVLPYAESDTTLGLSYFTFRLYYLDSYNVPWLEHLCV